MTFGGILTNFYGICVVAAGLNRQFKKNQTKPGGNFQRLI